MKGQLEIDFRQPWFLDPETQYPLSLYPTMEAPTVYTKTGEPYHKDPDEHHIFHTKKSYREAAVGLGGPVVKFSRIQTVRRYHHDAAHRMLLPPPILEHEKAQFDTSVWSLVNLIPRQAIDVRGDSPVVRGLTDDEYELLRRLTRADFSKSFHSSIGKFFLQTMLRLHGETVDNTLKDEFFDAKTKKQRRNVGNRILKLVALEAVDPLIPTYAQLKKDGEIPPEQKSPYKTVLQFAKTTSSLEKMIADELAVA
jgi:hypothetical protein